MKKKVIALNYLPKNGERLENTVDGVNIYTDLCGRLDMEDSVYMIPKAFPELFGVTRSASRSQIKRLAIVRIDNEESGKKIYRKYEYNPIFKGISENMIALHPASIRELAKGSNSEVVGKELSVSKGCSFMYYWNHPFHATRISMRLGFISIALAFLSIVITLLSLLLC